MNSFEAVAIRSVLITGLILSRHGLLRAADQPAPVACQADDQKTCSDAAKPDWQVAKEHVDKAWDACEPDVAKFCEGVQAGKDRVETCLDAHAVELSTGCQASRGHS